MKITFKEQKKKPKDSNMHALQENTQKLFSTYL